MEFKFRNINDAFRTLVGGIHSGTIPTEVRPSRYGEVIEVTEPVTITYARPAERVLFNAARNCNPFFHLYEALWMLAGRNDIAPLVYYNKRMVEFCDDGVTLNGAYGYRWRRAAYYSIDADRDDDPVIYDQLDLLVKHLKANTHSRRAVLQMWNVENDLLKIDDSKDVCCNLSVLFSVETGRCSACHGSGVTVDHRFQRPVTGSCPACGGKPHDVPRYLNMTVLNRSNDLCLAGETKFRSPEGDMSISDLAKKFQVGKGFRFPIYAVDTVSGDQRLCWMTNAWKSGIKPVYKVRFDDGTSVRLTGDHKLFKKTKVFEGKRCVGLRVEETQACDLRPGDRVLADVPETAATRRDAGGYIQFKKNLYQNTSYQNLGDEHRSYWEFMTGEELGEDEVHHRNENKADNRFSNLERLTKQEHRSYHLKKDNSNYKMTAEQVFDRASKGGKTHLGKPKSESHRAALSESAKQSQKFRQRDGYGRYMANHKVVAVEKDGVAVVYDFTVPGRHNAVLSNGVVAHNCWGLLGTNYVHFTVLQEYLAARLGLEVGVYRHFTNNLHAYTDNWEPAEWLADKEQDWYAPEFNNGHMTKLRTVPFVRDPAAFEVEVGEFVQRHNRDAHGTDYREPFLMTVAQPMSIAFHHYKRRQYRDALRVASTITADDWRLAATGWLERRVARRNDKERSETDVR